MKDFGDRASDPRALIEDLLPDESARRVCLSILADSIALADLNAPQRWGLTLREDRLRLNVGLIEVLTIGLGRFHCVVDCREIPDDLKQDPRVVIQEDAEDPARGFYPSVPGSVCIDFDADQATELYSLVASAHRSLLVKAGLTARNAATMKGHTPEALAYLADFLGRSVPAPQWAVP